MPTRLSSSSKQVATAPTPAAFALSSAEVNPLFKAMFLSDFKTVTKRARGISGRVHAALVDEMSHHRSRVHNAAALAIATNEAERLLDMKQKDFETLLNDDRYREAREKAGLDQKSAKNIQVFFLNKKNRKTLLSVLNRWAGLDFFGPDRASSLVRNVVLARSCETYAQFNDKIQQVRSGGRFQRSDPESIQARADNLERTFSSQYFQYQALVGSSEADALSEYCHIARSELALSASEVVDLVVASYFLKEDAMDGSRKEDRQRACLLHLCASGVFREYIFANAASYYFSRLSSQGPEVQAWRYHQKVAHKTAFASLVPNGRNETANNFANLEPNDVKMYEFWGKVTQLRSFREGANKVVSIFTLQSLHDDSDFEVSVAFRNLTTRGLQVGCLVNVNGTVYVSAEGTKRLRLDTLSLARNGRESWMDYLRNLFSPYFRFYTCNCNLLYSLEPADPAPQPSFMSEILFNFRD